MLGKITDHPRGESLTDDPQEGNYMFKVNNRNTRTRCEIGLK